VPSFEVVLRRSNRQDKIRHWDGPDAQIGDIIEVARRAWVIVEKQGERLICVPRRVRNMH